MMLPQEEPTQEIRLSNLRDGSLLSNTRCLTWILHLGNYVTTQLGCGSKVVLHCYLGEGSSLMAIDVIALERTKRISLMVLLNGSDIALGADLGSQINLCLPGLIDGMTFVRLLESSVQANDDRTQVSWMQRWARPPANQAHIAYGTEVVAG